MIPAGLLPFLFWYVARFLRASCRERRSFAQVGEAGECRADSLLQLHDHGEVAVAIELALQIATHVPNAEVRTIARFERAARWPTEGAARKVRVWREQARRRRPCECERRELVFGEDRLCGTAAAVSTRPAPERLRMPCCTARACLDRPEDFQQTLAKSAQLERERELLGVDLVRSGQRGELAPQVEQIIGAPPRLAQAVYQVLSGDEHRRC